MIDAVLGAPRTNLPVHAQSVDELFSYFSRHVVVVHNRLQARRQKLAKQAMGW